MRSSRVNVIRWLKPDHIIPIHYKSFCQRESVGILVALLAIGFKKVSPRAKIYSGLFAELPFPQLLKLLAYRAIDVSGETSVFIYRGGKCCALRTYNTFCVMLLLSMVTRADKNINIPCGLN